MRFHLWQRFSIYDNSVDESTIARLIEDNFASASMASGTHRALIEEITEIASVPLRIESLSEVLADRESPRGHYVFGCPGDYFDTIAQSYPNMLWWLTDNGLNM